MVTAKVGTTGSIGVSVDSGGTRGSVTVKSGAGITTLAGLTDVNATTVSDGSVLMFNGTTNKFTTTNTIEPAAGGTIIINGGSF
jgi:hypothetical protein